MCAEVGNFLFQEEVRSAERHIMNPLLADVDAVSQIISGIDSPHGALPSMPESLFSPSYPASLISSAFRLGSSAPGFVASGRWTRWW